MIILMFMLNIFLENNTLDTLKENQIIKGFYDLHKEVGILKERIYLQVKIY